MPALNPGRPIVRHELERRVGRLELEAAPRPKFEHPDTPLGAIPQRDETHSGTLRGVTTGAVRS